MLSDRCLSGLSVTLVYCGHTVGRIKMKLGMQYVGLGPAHIVLDGDAGPPPQRDTAPNLGPYLLWPNGSMDQDATWQEGRPRPTRHCVRLGPSSRPQKGDRAPKFSAHVYCAQTAGWIKMPLGMEVGLDPSDIVLDGNPAPPPRKVAEPPIFGPCLLWPNNWMDQDVTWYGGRPQPRPHCARWEPSSPSPKMGTASPNFRPIFAVAKRLDGPRCHLVRW